jgi:glycosyltransferase involved in cell wall biosynthesis
LRLLYVVSEDWYFLSHRLPMARAARDAGFEVHVATRVVDGAKAIEAEGFHLHPLPFARGRLSPLASWATVRALRRIHRLTRPAIAHHVALQATVLGSLAALGQPVSSVNALTGMGYAFTSASVKAMLLRSIIGALLRLLLRRPDRHVLVQNPNDRAEMQAFGIPADRIALIPGSGVDVRSLQLMPEPPLDPPTIAFVGRLLADKGVPALIEAHRLLRARGSKIELLLAGTPDPANPATARSHEIARWRAQPGVHLLGQVDRITTVWARAHVAVLPSRREGLPKSLLEAAACGRPMIATNVPGCREIVLPGKTGLLVPVDDAAALADAIERLMASADLRAQYGTAARDLAVERFSEDAIGRQIVELYRSVLANAKQRPTATIAKQA